MLPHDTSSTLGYVTILLAIGLGLMLFEVPKGKRISRVFYSLGWCGVGGALLFFISESVAATLFGFLLLCISTFGVLYYFSKGGDVYVQKK